MSLNWPSKLGTFEMGTWCRRYLRAHGIAVIELQGAIKEGPRAAEGNVQLRIRNEQFHQAVPFFKIICRDPAMFQGEGFFKDIQELRVKNKDFRSVFTVVLNAPPGMSELHYAREYGVAIIQISELRHMVNAMKMLKARKPATYQGQSEVIGRIFAAASPGKF